jgi:hypothetical protein
MGRYTFQVYKHEVLLWCVYFMQLPSYLGAGVAQSVYCLTADCMTGSISSRGKGFFL